ncbi:hypothetical protein YQE_07530, partial [Dendroctonus ponderosae]
MLLVYKSRIKQMILSKLLLKLNIMPIQRVKENETKFGNPPDKITAFKDILKCYATKAEKRKGLDRKPTPKLNPTAQFIASKGFLRAQREYVPPPDLESSLTQIFKDVLGKSDLNTEIVDLNQKFQLLTACSQKFGHSIPNSLLHQIGTLKEVLTFYATPVNCRTPLDKLRTMELPENLHVQFEYNRWHPETDTKFDGQTAFPESSTIVTGLKYKDKYKGHVQKIRFPQY